MNKIIKIPLLIIWWIFYTTWSTLTGFVVNGVINTFFRIMIVLMIPTIITEDPAPEISWFGIAYLIMGFIWAIQPILHYFNYRIDELNRKIKYRKWEIEE